MGDTNSRNTDKRTRPVTPPFRKLNGSRSEAESSRSPHREEGGQQDAQLLGGSRLLTVDEVAEQLHVSRSTVFKLMKNGELRVTSIVRKKCVTVRDLVDFIERRSTSCGC